MTNQLMIPEPQTKLELGSITLKNQEILEKAIDSFIERYQGTVVTADTLKESKHSRAELNKLSKALDAKRKQDKKAFLEPLDEYEFKIKNMKAKIDKCSTDINVQIKDFEQRERNAKQEQVLDLIEEMAPNYGVKPDEIELNPKWLNKSASKKSITEGIAGAMKERKRYNDDKAMVERYAKSQGFEFCDPYVDLLGSMTVIDIEEIIDDDAERKRKLDEAKRAAEQAEIEAKKATMKQVGDKLIDENTGKVETLLQEVSFTLRGTEQQLNNLAKFVKANGIKVVKATDRKEVIE